MSDVPGRFAETCKCGHGEEEHEAGECWADVEWAWGVQQCTCAWYESA